MIHAPGPTNNREELRSSAFSFTRIAIASEVWQSRHVGAAAPHEMRVPGLNLSPVKPKLPPILSIPFILFIPVKRDSALESGYS